MQKSLVGPTGVGWGLLQGLESLLRNDSVFLEPYVSGFSQAAAEGNCVEPRGEERIEIDF